MAKKNKSFQDSLKKLGTKFSKAAPKAVEEAIEEPANEIQEAAPAAKEVSKVEAPKSQKKKAEKITLYFRGSLLPVAAELSSLAIKSPISREVLDINILEGKAFLLQTAHYGEVLILEKDLEAAAEELASEEKDLPVAKDLFYLAHSQDKATKPNWLVEFEATL